MRERTVEKMNRVEIKICGITNLADARYLAAAGADYLGFVQSKASPRYLSASSAGEIIEWVLGPKCVGVFVNENVDNINESIGTAGFDLIQLHGNETVATCQAVDRPVIKAFRLTEGMDGNELKKRMSAYRNVVEYFLIDAFHPTQFGGTGNTVDWQLAASLASEFPLFLAGGLSPDNVNAAVQTVKPVGVDVSSGLEGEPGKKDFGKIDAFFSALERAEQCRESTS
ncbi:MAG: phosphoribosylanthranilate isomerase [Rhodothermia bacterium]|nr:MAG: phosphoribosylanthranilate isomerase [Rhodothermia bacterium]